MKYLIFSVLVVSLAGLIIPSAFAENVPAWVKNTAGWWADDSISDSDFLHGIKFLVETNIIQFQSDVDYEKSKNIEKYLLDWDTIVNDSKYAYEGSINVQLKFFNYVDYTVRYSAAHDAVFDTSEPTLLRAGVWLYQITGDEQFLNNAGYIADVIEEFYLYESGIVKPNHPFSNTVKVEEKHTNQEILSDVANLALVKR